MFRLLWKNDFCDGDLVILGEFDSKEDAEFALKRALSHDKFCGFDVDESEYKIEEVVHV